MSSSRQKGGVEVDSSKSHNVVSETRKLADAARKRKLDELFQRQKMKTVITKKTPDTVQKGPTRVTKAVAAAFADSESDQEEEIPTEACMRMRNIGKATITSSGPKSYGRSNDGFVNTSKKMRRDLEETVEAEVIAEETRDRIRLGLDPALINKR